MAESIWADSNQVQRRMTQQPGLTRQQALAAILDETLAILEETYPLHADLLRGRFWDGQTIKAMREQGRPEQQSKGRFYRQQRAALAEFLLLLQKQEDVDSEQSKRDTVPAQVKQVEPKTKPQLPQSPIDFDGMDPLLLN